MSDPGLLDRFRSHYRGRWRPEDALAWLDDPLTPGPSGAPGPANELDRMRVELYRRTTDEDAARRHHEAARRLEEELAVARAAFAAAAPRAPLRDQTREQDRRTAPAPAPLRARPSTAVGGVLVVAVVGAAAAGAGLVAPLAAPRSPAVPPALAFVAPATAGTPVWAAHGVGSLPSSPVLEAPGTPVVVALACRGRGAIHVLVDQQDRRVVCEAGRVRQDSEYFVGHHGRFTVALSISAPVAWVLTVRAAASG